MGRRSARSVTLDPNCRALRVYPMEGTERDVANLKTVGLKLSSKQAAHLACVLLAASQEWSELELTAYRLEKRRSDGTYHVTITTSKPR